VTKRAASGVKNAAGLALSAFSSPESASDCAPWLTLLLRLQIGRHDVEQMRADARAREVRGESLRP